LAKPCSAICPISISSSFSKASLLGKSQSGHYPGKFRSGAVINFGSLDQGIIKIKDNSINLIFPPHSHFVKVNLLQKDIFYYSLIYNFW
jgi:hypothetical protein